MTIASFVETPAAYFDSGAYVDLNQTVTLQASDDWVIEFTPNKQSQLTTTLERLFTDDSTSILEVNFTELRIGTFSTTSRFNMYPSSNVNGVTRISKTGSTINLLYSPFTGDSISQTVPYLITDDLVFTRFSSSNSSRALEDWSLYNFNVSINSTLTHHWPLVNNNFTDRITGIAGTPTGVTQVLQDNYHNVEDGLIPDKFGGKLEIDGTKYTIAELQNSTFGDTIFSSFDDPMNPQIITYPSPVDATTKAFVNAHFRGEI